ncbi:MAG: pseudouridine synthase [Myxococcota bacterium]|nr:pseudouridine synthase [Myxococcota bacterium]
MRPLVNIVFEDQHFIAIDKPPGLMVHRSELSRGVTEFALQRVRDYLNSKVYTVHRLDRPTSGILIFAKDAGSTKALSAQFARRTVTKKYVAVVRGFLPPVGRVEKKLEREPGQPPKAATTQWRVEGQWTFAEPTGRYETARYSRLIVTPLTGRRHQIRRHFAHLRHPIIGDVRYGDRHHNHSLARFEALNRLMLHAEQLSFDHPSRNDRVTIVSSRPDAFSVERWPLPTTD